MFEGTRLGPQELHAELLEIVEGQWFAGFDPVKHVTAEAIYSPMFPARLAIDCGTSQHTGAVFFQVRSRDELHKRIIVSGDFYYPEDPQNPHEDLMDALRGGIRDVFPDGRRALPALTTVPAARLF